MSKPIRVQRSRAKGWKMPANTVYVGRPTVWGNPFVCVEAAKAAEVVKEFRLWLVDGAKATGGRGSAES